MTTKTILLASALLATLPLSKAAGADDGQVAGKTGAQTSGELSTPGELIPMEQIDLPIIDGARVQGTLHFKLVLEADQAGASETLSANMPVLRSEALAVGAEFARLSASPFVAIDARRLAAELAQALQSRQAGIARVLLVEVTARSA
ncbi:hypothetical protein [Blastomonas aquatica]|uniref:Flagellar protein FliL n=1 Tax=Blastomonas aquatica TaxID=1510276 RepID=A0ABQ1JQR3_9SPHN|nr:hypothetical protein [Blastomonas aquatica]GGB74462.1 hypothetical protein GCM10010833_32100 [Blastomonas aquatica]